MEPFLNLTSEAVCRELLERYPDNLFVQDRLASLLRGQGRNDEASEVSPQCDSLSYNYHMGLLPLSERIRNRPNDPSSYLHRGQWHHQHGFFEKALADYDTAIKLDPTSAYAYCVRANLRATCPDDSFRDGQMALEDARTAMKLAEQSRKTIDDRNRCLYVQVLAAAYAENNDFQAAIELQTRALDLANSRSSTTSRFVISQRIEHYRAGKPTRNRKGLMSRY